MAATDIAPKKNVPLFRSMGRQERLKDWAANRGASAMLKWHLRPVGLLPNPCCHSFRSTTDSDLITQGVPLEDNSYHIGHSDPRTTRLYDRTKHGVTRNIVE